MFTESGKFIDKPGRWFSSVRSLLEMFHCSPTDQPTVVDRERVEVLRIVASRSKVTFTRRHSGEKGEEGDIVMKNWPREIAPTRIKWKEQANCS